MPPRWTAITAALTCAVVFGGCGPGHIHQPLSLELGDPASAAGAFSINEDDVYEVALEVRPTGDSAELRGRVRSYFEVSFERPLVAHVVLSRKSPGKAPAVIVEKSISAPDFSAWNSDAMTMKLARSRLPEGDYEVRATLSGRKFRSYDYRTRLVVEHAYTGK